MASKPQYINVKGNLIDLSVPRVMGIINVTPDSFFSGSRAETEVDIISKAGKMLEEGADFIDIGGWSSRPGAGEITPEEERKRVLNAVRAVSSEFPEAVISVDTYRSDIAERAILEYGASMINDISGGENDRLMFQTAARLQVPYIMMHMQGKPSNMQENPFYEDVTAEIIHWFGERIVKLQSMGVNDIIIDPGFGFGKNIGHNFELLKHLGDFSITGLPLLAGVSRKSVIWKTLGITPEEALNGTTVLNTVALLAGADILRVHDVKEAVQAVKLVYKLKNSGN
ncbi:MAG: dihydropteroate synthase [Bacteroidales bacterium]|nr:dihydropteroate synthase [Bacteroidales bacterium]